MTWLFVIGLAGAAFAAAAMLLRLPRACWSLFAAALMVGLAGYALQGSPDVLSAPGAQSAVPPATGELLVSARREFYGQDTLPARFVVTSDAFARRGNWQDAAGFLGNALKDNPRDSEAWLALAMALVEHAGGQITPAAQTAFDRAALSDDKQLGPAFFYGLTKLREGDAAATYAVWSESLAKAPSDAKGREILATRLAMLEDAVARAQANAAVSSEGR